ncbi:MAG: hypothetical protein ACQEP1_00330 [Nanobdellota archaeon]
MTYYNWRDFFMALENWGFSDVLLPFLLIFTIVYAVFQKTKILGEKKSYNIILAFVMAMATVIPHVTGNYPMGYDPIEILHNALPTVSIVVVAIIMVLLLVGLWGAESDWVQGNTVTGTIVLLSVLAVFYIFGASANWWEGWSWLEGIFGTDTMAVLVMVLVFGLVLWFVTKDEGQSKGDGFVKGLSNMFKKE